MTDKTTKAKLHQVVSCVTQEQKSEVFCKDRERRGIRRARVVQECVLKNDDISSCSCFKPKLLHIPYSHVLDACAECQIPSEIYVSDSF
jgi:hypothetical protein